MNKVFIGMEGSGCDVEFDVVRTTEKAYLIQFMGKEFWFPLQAVADDGELTPYGYRLWAEKVET